MTFFVSLNCHEVEVPWIRFEGSAVGHVFEVVAAAVGQSLVPKVEGVGEECGVFVEELVEGFIEDWVRS